MARDSVAGRLSRLPLCDGPICNTRSSYRQRQHSVLAHAVRVKEWSAWAFDCSICSCENAATEIVSEQNSSVCLPLNAIPGGRFRHPSPTFALGKIRRACVQRPKRKARVSRERYQSAGAGAHGVSGARGNWSYTAASVSWARLRFRDAHAT